MFPDSTDDSVCGGHVGGIIEQLIWDEGETCLTEGSPSCGWFLCSLVITVGVVNRS